MSQIRLSPYINFQGQARAAMEFYQRVLGGELDLQTINAQGTAVPAGPGDRVTYARLVAADALIIGSDGHPNFPAQVGENLALALEGRDTARLTEIFHALAVGGQIKMPLGAQPRGGEVGWLTDQFGINWMVAIEPA